MNFIRPEHASLADQQLIHPDAAGPALTAAKPIGPRWLLGLGLVLIALNLRIIFSSASALLPEISRTLGLSSAGAGLLTTLPVVCLGAFSLAAPRLAQKFGAERTLLGVLLLLALGTALRAIAATAPLFIGTALAGASIAVGNVLLPGLVKRDFAHRAALMTGLYSMALCASAAAAAGLTVPLEHALGDQPLLTLGVWAAPAVVVALIWLPQTFAANAPRRAQLRVTGLWRDRRAWQVTLFMGLQSALAYCVFGWLVPILRERGLDAVSAGGIVSFSVVLQALACLVVPQLAVRGRDQRLINVSLCVIAVIGLLGLLFAPLSTVLLWAIAQGIGQGGLIAVALTVIVLRAPNATIAAELSGMAQCVGYLLAAIGPLAVGLLHGWSGSFDITAILFVLLGLGAAIAGWGAGRTGYVAAQITAAVIERQPPA